MSARGSRRKEDSATVFSQDQKAKGPKVQIAIGFGSIGTGYTLDRPRDSALSVTQSFAMSTSNGVLSN
jgi:hypothetical protein